eukprot:1252941-Lingulodinium_polyedra.AAC.1
MCHYGVAPDSLRQGVAVLRADCSQLMKLSVCQALAWQGHLGQAASDMPHRRSLRPDTRSPEGRRH